MTRFLGIPYAASPTGPRRFAAPEPPEPWDGVRECIAFSATPPKPDYPAPFDTILPEPSIPGEDWLSLNVWTRDLTGLAPVMVWIHGGAFVNGNSAVPIYDGHAFARDGVVLVSINYRLGIDGFAFLPDAPAPANRGLLDQVAALEWVRDNIGAFGGDPANVTIFGESAGGMSVTTLLGMPRAQGLFARVIAQSGSAQAGADPQRRHAGDGRARRRARIRGDCGKPGRPGTGQAHRGTGGRPGRHGRRAGPSPVRPDGGGIVDGIPAGRRRRRAPAPPASRAEGGVGADIALMTGTNTEEFRLFLVPNGTAAMVTDETLPGFLAALGIPADTAAVYRANRPGGAAGDVHLRAGDRPFLPEPGVRRCRGAGGRWRPGPDLSV